MKPSRMVPRARFELAHPCGYYALNVARLPFRHLGSLLLVGEVGLEPTTSCV